MEDLKLDKMKLYRYNQYNEFHFMQLAALVLEKKTKKCPYTDECLIQNALIGRGY